jgi:hypothetical protein
MSTQAAEQHEKAADQYGHAARHDKEAAEHHRAGNYETDFSVPLSGVPTTQGNRTSAMKVFEI